MFTSYASKYFTKSNTGSAPLFRSVSSQESNTEDAFQVYQPSKYQKMDEEDEPPPHDIIIEMQPHTGSSMRSIAVSTKSREEECGHRHTTDPSTTLLQIAPNNPETKDHIWALLYYVNMVFFLSTSFLVWLRDESSPLSNSDTLYTALHSGNSIFLIDVGIALLLSFLWLLMMRLFLRPLTYVLFCTVPFFLVGISVYPFVMSYRGRWGGESVQDEWMGFSAVIPLAFAAAWTFSVWRWRNALGSAITRIEASCSILNQNPSLVVFSISNLTVFVLFTLLWIQIFSLTAGHGYHWIIRCHFVFTYLWTWGVFSAFRRSVISSSISSWYFYRHSHADVSSMRRISSSAHFALSSQLGTICLHALISILTKFPLLPRLQRISSFISTPQYLGTYDFDTSLSSPLVLVCASIYAVPLTSGQKILSNYTHSVGHQSADHLIAYRLSKILLSAARLLTSLGLGFAGWVKAAHFSNGGSLYGYIVGIMSAIVGYSTISATEGCVSQVMDAVLVCDLSDHHTSDIRRQEIQHEDAT